MSKWSKTKNTKTVSNSPNSSGLSLKTENRGSEISVSVLRSD